MSAEDLSITNEIPWCIKIFCPISWKIRNHRISFFLDLGIARKNVVVKFWAPASSPNSEGALRKQTEELVIQAGIEKEITFSQQGEII